MAQHNNHPNTPVQQPKRERLVITQEHIDGFRSELMARQREVRAVLPAHVTIDAFNATAISAIRNRPELLETAPKTLWRAITQAAEDGLMPDGKQGVINAYWDKNAFGENQSGLVAQWMPMLYGIRKRAMELSNMIIDAQVVHENDPFVCMLGDNPRIEHGPINFMGERGKMFAVYAIFRSASGEILHREPMSREEVMKAKSVSKAQGGPMWSKFESEAWRKTAVRRGSKTVPMAPELERIVRRDDEHVDFSLRSAPITSINAPQPSRQQGNQNRPAAVEQRPQSSAPKAVTHQNQSEAHHLTPIQQAASMINWKLIGDETEAVPDGQLFQRVMTFIDKAESDKKPSSVLVFKDINQRELAAFWQRSEENKMQAFKIKKRITEIAEKIKGMTEAAPTEQQEVSQVQAA